MLPARLVAAVLLLASRGALGADALVVTIDTLRADHVGAWGYPAAVTPHLDRLSRRGALLANVHAHVPLTLPSHASLFTGRIPSRLALPVNGLRLGAGTPTLATALSGRGVATAAVVSAVVVDRESGLAAGFDTYDDAMTAAPSRGPGAGTPVERRGDETLAAARRLLPSLGPPGLLWVHLYDPHHDYRPPEPHGRTAATAAAAYDGEVAFADAQLGGLLGSYRAAGRAPVVLVASDHGEGLGDHGEPHHGVTLYEPTMHVPAVISWPGEIPEGRVHAGLLGLADVGATLADLLGAALPAADGRSIATSIRSAADGLPAAAAARVPIESYHGYFSYGWAPLRGVMTPEWKLIVAPRPELYRLADGEGENLHAREARIVAMLTREVDAGGDATGVVDTLRKDGAESAQLERLKSLGYLSGERGSDRLDPKDGLALEARVAEAAGLLELGDEAKAGAILAEVLSRNPGNVPALSIAGTAALRRGDAAAARRLFQRQLDLALEKELAHFNLATLARRTGDLAAAEGHFEKALALRPRLASAVAGLAECRLARGATAAAIALLEDAARAGVRSADILLQHGVALSASGRAAEARRRLTECLTLDPTRHEALANLGSLAWQAGDTEEAIASYERALRIAPDDARYLATLASIHQYGRRDLPAALTLYRRALAADPYGPEAANLKQIVASLEALLSR